MRPAQTWQLYLRAPSGLVLFAVGAVVASWIVVLLTPSSPYYDQSVLLNSPLGVNNYPVFNDGLASKLLGEGLSFLFSNNLVAANAAYRGITSTLYILAAAALATTVLSRRSQFLFILALLATGYPVLWLSSELLGGASLCLAIWLIVGRRSPVAIAVSLAVFGLAKPDLLLPAIALAAVYVAIRPTTRIPFIVSYFLATGAFVAPGILAHGSAFFATDRSFLAFGQHYAALITAHRHEVLPSPRDPWINWRNYVQEDFPGAQSVIQAIQVSPGYYVEFVWLAIKTGVLNAGKTFSLWSLLVALRLVFALRKAHPLSRTELWYLIPLVGLIPEVLISYPHIRYLAKYTPLVLLMGLALLDGVKGSREKLLIGALVMTSVIYSSARLAIDFGHYLSDVRAASQQTPSNGILPPGSTNPFFWFPD